MRAFLLHDTDGHRDGLLRQSGVKLKCCGTKGGEKRKERKEGMDAKTEATTAGKRVSGCKSPMMRG